MKIVKNSLMIALCISSISIFALSRKTFNEQYNNQLVNAIEKNNVVEVNNLLKKGANPNAKKEGKTALMIAIAHSGTQTNIVEVLLKYNADANLIDSSLMSPLEFATYNYKNPQIINLLLHYGAKITPRVNLGYTRGQIPPKEDAYDLARKELAEWEILPEKEIIAEEQNEMQGKSWRDVVRYWLGF